MSEHEDLSGSQSKQRRPGHNEGSIFQRKDGRWTATITLDPKGGKRQRRSFYGKTRADVAKQLTAALRSHEENLPLPSLKQTVETHLKSWLETKKSTLRPDVWRRYDDYCNRWIIPALGRRRLAKLTIEDVKDLHKGLVERGLSGTSVQHAHGVLRAALQDALRWGLVARNVAALVPAPKRSTGEMRFLGPDEAKELLKTAKGTDLEALFVVALTAGLRVGELQALRWRDVDTQRQRLRVSATLTAIADGAPVFGEPKTQHSRRTVWLSGTAADALERHRSKQEDARRNAGTSWTEHGLVFTNGFGQPLWRSHIWRAFKDLLTEAKLPDMRIHDLRHTAATVLLAEGVPIKVASELLGHSDVKTTLRIYAHVIEGAQEQAASAMDRLFHA